MRSFIKHMWLAFSVENVATFCLWFFGALLVEHFYPSIFTLKTDLWHRCFNFACVLAAGQWLFTNPRRFK